MHIENVLNKYPEEIVPISYELKFLEEDIITDEISKTSIESFDVELYGTKNKKFTLNLSNNLQDENINIIGIEILTDYLTDAICRIELELSGQVVYWIDQYTIILLLSLINEDSKYIDILKYFVPALPISILKHEVELVFTYKPEYIQSDACIKKEELHKIFKYHNYDADYDRDFGYNEKAFNYITVTKYNVFSPELIIKYTQTVFPKEISIPIIQLYRLFDGKDNGKLQLKNTLLFGIASQIIFVTYSNIDISKIPFKIIMERGVINNIYLKRHPDYSHIYILNMPERKSRIKDKTIIISYPESGYIVEIYAAFTNAITINETIKHLTYFVHH